MWNKFISATCGADTQIIQQGASERAQTADEACAAVTEQKENSLSLELLYSKESSGLCLLAYFK